MADKIPVAVAGATGSVGQRFVQLLDGHPHFQVVALAGSERSVGQPYGSACRWVLPQAMPTWAREMTVVPLLAPGTESSRNPVASKELLAARVLFSALPSEQARQVEPVFAGAGLAVCSNASAFREEPDVPLLLPEVNPDHLGLISVQQQRRGWNGCIVTNPNCTSTGLTVALKALQDAFGLRRAFVVSLQALSGAGYPGVPSLDIIDNVIPYIGSEEEKVEWEPRKMLGHLEGGAVRLADVLFSAHTNRVAVSDGHMVCVSLELAQLAGLEDVRLALRSYMAPPASRDLPSTPRPVIVVSEEPDRPQPRLDRMTGGGMTTVVGRLRPDPLLHWKFVVLSHNTIRGAAGGSLYNAELMHSQGYI